MFPVLASNDLATGRLKTNEGISGTMTLLAVKWCAASPFQEMLQTFNSAESLGVFCRSRKSLQSKGDSFHIRFAELDKDLEPTSSWLTAFGDGQRLIHALSSTESWRCQILATANPIEQTEITCHLPPTATNPSAQLGPKLL